MKELYQFFTENFVEGKRYDLIMRLAGSCAVLNVPMEDCINFYNLFKDRDDEDRTHLIERTYKKVAEGKKVLTLKPYEVDVAGYFGYTNKEEVKYLNVYDKEEYIKKLVNNELIRQDKNIIKTIDISSVSVKLDKKVHKKEYFYLKTRKITDFNIRMFDIRVGIGKLENRVVFPIYNKNKECIYYVARAINNDIQPRYLNSKLPKEAVIWNYYNCRYNKPVIVCEGIFNAITAINYTGMQAVATLGKFLTDTQKLMLSKFKTIYLCFDGDVEEYFVRNIADELSCPFVYILKMPKDRDVNDLTKKEFLDIFNSAIKIDKEEERLYNILRRLK
jgi:hypothetical protein